MHIHLDKIAFQFGGIIIYWYGILVCLGFMAAYLFMQFRSAKQELPPEKIADICFAAMVGGIIGARILYVILNLDYYIHDPVEVIRIDRGGLVFFGGFFGATLSVLWLVRKNHLPLGDVADLIALGLPLGQAFGRVGCFVNGCCFGKPTDSPIAVIYPHDSLAWYSQIDKQLITGNSLECLPIIPTQIVQGTLNLGIWFGLLMFASTGRFRGRLFPIYLVAYSIFRFINEFTRGDYDRYYLGLTISQVICLLILPIGLYLFNRSGRNALDTKKNG